MGSRTSPTNTPHCDAHFPGYLIIRPQAGTTADPSTHPPFENTTGGRGCPTKLPNETIQARSILKCPLRVTPGMRDRAGQLHDASMGVNL